MRDCCKLEEAILTINEASFLKICLTFGMVFPFVLGSPLPFSCENFILFLRKHDPILKYPCYTIDIYEIISLSRAFVTLLIHFDETKGLAGPFLREWT